MAYADYTYYTESYCGSAVSEADFTRLAAKASAFIDRVTFNRAAQHTESDNLKCCCCDLVDTLAAADDSGGIKQSENVGSYSYSLNSAAANKSAEDMMYTKCRTWLPPDWMYRGMS